MEPLNRIVVDPQIMNGKPCIRGTRVTVATIAGMIAAGHDVARLLELYPYLSEEDVNEALTYSESR